MYNSNNEYIPLNKTKETNFDSILEKYITNLPRLKTKEFKNTKNLICTAFTNEVSNSQVNIILNKLTNKIANSIKPADIIQSALEYNNYLIDQLEQNKHKLTISEYENALILLWENIKKLAVNVDNFTSKFNLNENKSYCELYSKYLQRKKNREPSGLTIVIDKSIIREYEEKQKLEMRKVSEASEDFNIEIKEDENDGLENNENNNEGINCKQDEDVIMKEEQIVSGDNVENQREVNDSGNSGNSENMEILI
jgi:hypothetical protein